MFETKRLTREIIEQRRKDRKAKRCRNRKTLRMQHCHLCGVPKSYVCLEHHANSDQKSSGNFWINKHRCHLCGVPKSYICLKDYPNWKKKGIKKLWKQIRYNSKKLYFNLAKKLNLAE